MATAGRAEAGDGGKQAGCQAGTSTESGAEAVGAGHKDKGAGASKLAAGRNREAGGRCWKGR